MKLTIIDIAHHRNGICSAPFAAVLFEDTGQEGSRKIGILFDKPDHCAVLDIAKLAAGDIAFASNSWRGDQYEPHLRAANAQRAVVEPPEPDIHEHLATRHEIAVFWAVEDVQQVRPDLSAEQAWEVLRAIERYHDATIGINWDVLSCHAEMLFGNTPETGEVEEG